jgi:hypothetical protein
MALVLVMATACDILGPDPDEADPKIASIEIVGLDTDAHVDDEPSTLRVRARDNQGRIVPGIEPTWSVSDESIATIEAGRLIGRQAGRVIVAATYDGASDSQEVLFDYEMRLRIVQIGSTVYDPEAVHPLSFGDSVLVEVSVPTRWMGPIGAAGLADDAGHMWRLVNFDLVEQGERQQRWVAAGGWGGGEYRIWFDFGDLEPDVATVRVEPYPELEVIAVNGQAVGATQPVAEDSAVLRVQIDVPDGAPEIHQIVLLMEGEHEGLLPWIVGREPWSLQRRIHGLELGPGIHEIEIKAALLVPGEQRLRIEVRSTDAAWRNQSDGPVALSDWVDITMQTQ